MDLPKAITYESKVAHKKLVISFALSRHTKAYDTIASQCAKDEALSKSQVLKSVSDHDIEQKEEGQCTQASDRQDILQLEVPNMGNCISYDLPWNVMSIDCSLKDWA